VRVKVHVWDEDGRTNHDFVDSLQTRIMVAAAGSESAAEWTSFVMNARTRSIEHLLVYTYRTISYRISCTYNVQCTALRGCFCCQL